MKAFLTTVLILFSVIGMSQNTYRFSPYYNVSVDDSLTIIGTIRSKGIPAKGVQVKIANQTTTTDDEGKFELTTLKTTPKIKIRSKRFQDLTIKKLKFNKGDQLNLTVNLEPDILKFRSTPTTPKAPEASNYITSNYPSSLRGVITKKIKSDSSYVYFMEAENFAYEIRLTNTKIGSRVLDKTVITYGKWVGLSLLPRRCGNGKPTNRYQYTVLQISEIIQD